MIIKNNSNCITKAQQVLSIFQQIQELAPAVSKKGIGNFDIDKEFDYLNKTLFDSQVVKPPILGFMVDRKRVGVVNSTYRDGKPVSISLLISNSYDLTIQQFRSILCHEFIHLIQNTKGMVIKNQADAHSGFFLVKMKEINDKIIQLGLQDQIESVKPTEDSTVIKTFENDKLKQEAGIILVKYTNRKGEIENYISAMSLDGLMLNLDTFTKSIKTNYPLSEIEYYKCQSSFLKKYKIVSSNFRKNFSIIGISDIDYQTLVKDGIKINPDEIPTSTMLTTRLKKSVGVMLVKKSDNSCLAGIAELEGLKANMDYYKDLFKYNYKKNYSIYFLSSDNFILSNYPMVKKNFTKIGMYKISDTDYASLINDPATIIIDKTEM